MSLRAPIGALAFMLAYACVLGAADAIPGDELDYGTSCLSLAGFAEDREHGDAGMAAVMVTVVNRVRDPRWPDTVCDVVFQSGQYVGVSNWKPPRRPEQIDARAWADAQRLAAAILGGDMSAVPRACREATSFDQGPAPARLREVCRVGVHALYVNR